VDVDFAFGGGSLTRIRVYRRIFNPIPENLNSFAFTAKERLLHVVFEVAWPIKIGG